MLIDVVQTGIYSSPVRVKSPCTMSPSISRVKSLSMQAEAAMDAGFQVDASLHY